MSSQQAGGVGWLVDGGMVRRMKAWSASRLTGDERGLEAGSPGKPAMSLNECLRSSTYRAEWP
eukprot:12642420-Alexandrium_andersonii.AAC.1